MMRVAAIVEGIGDVSAIPALIAKTGELVSIPAIAPNPIRCGEWKRLRRQGELERVLTLAATRLWDIIMIIVDLEDDCALVEQQSAWMRINSWIAGRNIKVELIFLTREYETLFLHEPSCLGSIDTNALPSDPEEVRGAKERVKAAIGARYKESQDQLKFTKSLDLKVLYSRSRSFRKLCRALTGMDYDMLQSLIDC